MPGSGTRTGSSDSWPQERAVVHSSSLELEELEELDELELDELCAAACVASPRVRTRVQASATNLSIGFFIVFTRFILHFNLGI